MFLTDSWLYAAICLTGTGIMAECWNHIITFFEWLTRSKCSFVYDHRLNEIKSGEREKKNNNYSCFSTVKFQIKIDEFF
jgi:hypothetical protein